jgi:hypothetical protein
MGLSKKIYRVSRVALLFLGMFVAAACTQTAPEPTSPTVVLSTTRIPVKGFIEVKGSGFTPKTELVSHLKKPTGTEYPLLPMLSDEKGEITHEIDTLLLAIGTHQLWIVDTKTGVSSNIAEFEVMADQPPPAR